MRALLLNGALGPDPLLDDLTERLTDDFVAREYAVQTVVLRDVPVAYCQGCFECWTHTPGICMIDDKGRDLSRDFTMSDVVVFVTPVQFGSYSSETKKMLDRTLGVLLPFFRRIDGETHHFPRYAYPPAFGVLAVEDVPDAANEKTLRVLVTRNAINFASPVHAVSVIGRRTAAALVFGECGALVSTLTTPPPLLDDAAASLAEGRCLSPVTREAFSEPLMPAALCMMAGDAGWLWTSLHENALTRLWQRPAEARV